MSGLHLAGKHAVVTGAKGGIGKKICEMLAGQGVHLWACIRRPDALFEQWLAQTADLQRINARAVYMEFEDGATMDVGLRSILDEKKPVDILINCAGVMSTALLNATTIDEIRRVYEINFFSQLHIIRALSKRMIRARSGNIINFSSYAGMQNLPGRIAYGGSKNAIAYATRTLASEYKPYNIRVNAVAPGPVDTDMIGHYSQQDLEAFRSMTYDKRLGTVEDIANLVMFLASDVSSHINGQIIQIDGGM